MAVVTHGRIARGSGRHRSGIRFDLVAHVIAAVSSQDASQTVGRWM